MKQFLILCDASGNQKFKMAAHQEEILSISQPVYNITAQFQQQHPCFWGQCIQCSIAAISHTVWCQRKSNIQDGGSQIGNTHISAYIQHNCTIPTAIPGIYVHWRYPCFQGQQFQWRYLLYSVVKAEIKNSRWWLTNKKYLYLSLYTTLLHNSNCDSHVFKFDNFNEAIYDIVLCEWESEIRSQLRACITQYRE